MKKIAILSIATILCLTVWGFVILSLLQPSEIVIDEVLEKNTEVETQYLPEETPPQIVKDTLSNRMRTNGITLNKARELSPDQVISVDELLEILEREEADTN